MWFTWRTNRDLMRKLDLIYSEIIQTRRHLMAKIDDLILAVTDEGTVIASAITLLETLHTDLVSALASPNSDAAVQAVIDTIQKHKADMAAAITANTPADPALQPDPPGMQDGPSV